jgi:hypothetical protein
MDMHTYLSLVISGLCLLLLSTGCGKSTTLVSAANLSNRAPVLQNTLPPPIVTPAGMPEVFDAVTLPGVGAGMVTIETDLPADITVVAFPSDEVGLDYIAQGGGSTEQLSAAEAHKNVAVALDRVAGGALIWARLLSPAADTRDYVKLHVRVPHHASLVVKATNGGNVTVSGEMASVHVHTARGTITVNGVVGPAQLMTENGSINVDAFAQPQSNQVQHLELHARSGDINLMAVGANVLAATTEGNIRFVGSLSGDNNSFSTTGNGRVLVTMPNDLSYRFDVESRQRIVNDFMPATLICAMAKSPDTRMSTAPSPDLIGQIVSSDPVITTTYSFKSVAGRYREKPYLYFRDDHSVVTRFLPEGDVLPNGGNAAQAFWSPDCDSVKQQIDQNTPPPTVGLHISAETGEVVLRLIRKH